MAKEFLKSALEYQKMGLSVIPILPKQKKAAVEWRTYQQRCATKEEIVEWWHEHPDYNIGIVTGKVSGTTVVDLDKYKPNFNPDLETQFFDSIVTPTVETPNGGNHLWMNYIEGLTIGSNVLPAIDIRGDGGYIVAPPSVNGNGKPYKWIVPLGTTMSDLPASFLASLNTVVNEYNKTHSIYKVVDNLVDNTTVLKDSNVQTVQKCLQEGSRNADIFTVATSLARGGCKWEVAVQIIEILANNANPPYPLKEAHDSLRSAYNRKESHERNIHEEVREYILSQKCLHEVHISSTDCLRSLQLSTRNDKKAAYAALARCCDDEKLLEKQQGVRGIFKILDSKIDDAVMDLVSEPEVKEFNVNLPLDLNRLCVISPGNIIVVSGSKSAGKTAFMMNVAWKNQKDYEVHYLNSEMHETEFKKRMKKFGPLNKWKIQGYKCHNNFADYIKGDPNHIYIIDFMEIHDNFYEIGKHIRAVHEKLGDSICFIAIQMKGGAALGRGADFSAEKSRLYLSMDFIQSELKTKVTIYDAKEPRPPEDNVRGMFNMVKIIEGNKLDGDRWRRGSIEDTKDTKKKDDSSSEPWWKK